MFCTVYQHLKLPQKYKYAAMSSHYTSTWDIQNGKDLVKSSRWNSTDFIEYSCFCTRTNSSCSCTGCCWFCSTGCALHHATCNDHFSWLWWMIKIIGYTNDVRFAAIICCRVNLQSTLMTSHCMTITSVLSKHTYWHAKLAVFTYMFSGVIFGRNSNTNTDLTAHRYLGTS